MSAVAPPGANQSWADPPRDDPHRQGKRSSVRDSVARARQLWPRPDELNPEVRVVRSALVVLCLLALSFWFHLAVISRLQHDSAQARMYAQFRNELARGVAPTGSVDFKGRLLALGRPVALVDIPSIGVHQIVGEGTTSSVLMSGPGHLRNTALPGQAGLSVIYGRAAAYGGPFGRLHRLRHGAKITVTTGIGKSDFLVIGVRRAGDPQPQPLGDGNGRLTLVTATGWPFVPSGVLRVDADLVSRVQSSSAAGLSAVPRSEQPMGRQTNTLWQLVLLLQALILAAVAAVWSWRGWGRPQTWIVFSPLILLIGYHIAGQVTRLLPNLM